MIFLSYSDNTQRILNSSFYVRHTRKAGPGAMNPRKTGKPGPYGHPTKTGKIGRGTLVEPQHDLEKPENHDPNGFLRKPKKKDPAP